MESRTLADRISELILDKKGSDILIMDMKQVTTIADYFVICSADSDAQAKAITEYIVEKLRDDKLKPWHIEGTNTFTWVLLDFVDVVVHVFQPESRKFYSLERLWGDAEFIEVKDQDETTGLHSK